MVSQEHLLTVNNFHFLPLCPPSLSNASPTLSSYVTQKVTSTSSGMVWSLFSFGLARTASVRHTVCVEYTTETNSTTLQRKTTHFQITSSNLLNHGQLEHAEHLSQTPTAHKQLMKTDKQSLPLFDHANSSWTPSANTSSTQHLTSKHVRKMFAGQETMIACAAQCLLTSENVHD